MTMTDALVTIMVEKGEILNEDVSRVRQILNSFIPQLFDRNRNGVVILINGYDEDSRDLYRVAEVRTWYHRLFDAVPEFFFWMDMRQKRLAFYALMMGEPQRVDGGTTVSAEDMRKFMVWGHTKLNIFCQAHGLDPSPSNDHIKQCLTGKK